MSYLDAMHETSIEIVEDKNTNKSKQLTTSSEIISDYKHYCCEMSEHSI